jgi:PAS domain S-box-containing protein
MAQGITMPDKPTYEAIEQRLRELEKSCIENKRAEQELRKVKELNEDIVETIRDGIVLTNTRGVVTYVNQALATMLGYLPARMAGRPWLDFVVPEQRVIAQTADKRRTRGQTDRYELTMQRKDGSRLYVLIGGNPRFDKKSGQFIGTLGVITDNSQRIRADKELRESEALFRNLFENHAAVMLIIDPESGTIIDANNSATKFYGWTRKQLQQMRIQDINTLEPEEIKQAMERARTDQRFHFEFRHRRVDGSIRDVDVFSSKIKTKGKDLLYSVIHDITVRKQVERALRDSEKSFIQLFESAPLPMAYASEAEGYWGTTWNEAWYQTFGYSREQAEGRSGNDIGLWVDPEDRSRFLDLANRQNYVTGFETRLRRHDGSVLDCSLFGRFIDKAGQRLLMAVYLDVTDRKQAETELKKSHKTFLTVMDGIDATVYVADMHSHEILFMNKHMIDAFGGDFTGQRCYYSFRGESGPCGDCTNDRLLDADGQPTGVSVREARNPVTGKWYINHDRAIRWLDGRMVKLQIASDVTTIKEMEAERNRIGEQLKQAQKMESVGRLAGGVAHDFNNMLGAILGYTELGMMGVSPTDPIHAILNDIQKAAQRSADLTRQLLAFARKQTVTPQVLDLNETVEGMLNMLRQLIGENIDLDWLPGKDLGPVRMDPSQIEQLLANLCVNARDAINDTGNITVRTHAATLDETDCTKHVGPSPGEYVLLTVSDNGCGMDAETLTHLFEPFFTTKEIGKGTGLGLATVYGMVKQNNGFIDVSSQPDQGTTFRIYLPLHAAETGRKTKKDVTQLAARGNETILLVEDEPMILDIAVKILTRQGYTVMAAATPGEAIRLARESADEIHLLMTDVVMPEMNGRELAENLLSVYPNIKRLFMSGYTADVIAHHGVLDKGVQFIQKPFSVQTLAAKVREVLDEMK